ncbi:MAG TPA: PDDEXK nuclease domain-containing protein [Candidatus Babeliales bacterium]|nr:PDDEXK nuclease domain-containing protein [Candidatus Babeliales bacterium]
MNIEKTNEYAHFLQEIKDRIRDTQANALKSVNKYLISLYWSIGKDIVEKQKKNGWGDSVIEGLAVELQKALPGIKGFSARNLWKMRDLYVSYSSKEKLQPLVAEISWTNNIYILGKCKDPLEREFYVRMVRKYGWSKNSLINHISNQTYERTFLGQSNFDVTLPAQIQDNAKLIVKDEYTFDFLELGDDFSERQLENSLVARVEDFLKEMGGIFSFVGRQYRLEVDDKEYFLDILLYHRILRCLVIIELKIGEFIPEYIGKMQFYLAAVDAQVKTAEENPSIGIILCKSKSKMTVEYALKESNKPIGVASYTVVKKLPKELKDQLPNAEQIAKLIGKIE